KRRREVGSGQQTGQHSERGRGIATRQPRESRLEGWPFDRTRGVCRQERQSRFRAFEQLRPLEQRRRLCRWQLEDRLARELRIFGREGGTSARFRQGRRQQSLGPEPGEDRVALGGLALRQTPARQCFRRQRVHLTCRQLSGEAIAEQRRTAEVRIPGQKPVPAPTGREAPQPVATERAAYRLPGVVLEEGIHLSIQLLPRPELEVAFEPGRDEIVMNDEA